MTIQDLVALGEFLGLFLVLATLIYLSSQTRQANQVAASETPRGVVSDFIGLWDRITRDAEFADIIRRAFNDWYSLSKTEQLRSHSFLFRFCRPLRSSVQGQLHPRSRFLLEVLGRDLAERSPDARWLALAEQCQFFFDAEFVEQLNVRLAKPDDLPPSCTSVAWWQLE